MFSFAPIQVPTAAQPSSTFAPIHFPTAAQPSLQPSTFVPIHVPTTSQPSVLPTIAPILANTTAQPSLKPSTFAPILVNTTAQPSLQSSTFAPILVNTTAQHSLQPSTFPTTTLSTFPSDWPSTNLSQEPPNNPSISPSTEPTSSLAPSTLTFETITIQGNDDGNGEGEAGQLAICKIDSSSNKTFIPQVLTFDYILTFHPNFTTIEEALPLVESRLNRILAIHFLACATPARRLILNSSIYDDNDVNSTWSSLSSLPKDIVTEHSVCTANETVLDSTCIVISGGITPELSQTTTMEELYATVGDFLLYSTNLRSIPNQVPGVTGISVRGFTHVSVGGGDITPDYHATVTGAAQSTDSNTTNPALVGGSVAIVVAAVGLLLVGILLVKRQRTTRALTYLKQAEDSQEVYSLGNTASEEELPQKKHAIVWNDSEDSESIFEYAYGEEHQIETCASTTCQICQDNKLQRPMFVKAEVMQEEIQRDLGLGQSRADIPREYYSPNTVDL